MNHENLFSEYMAGKASLEALLSLYENVNNIAKREDLERFLSNKTLQGIMSFDTGVETAILKAQAQKLLDLFNC